MSLTYQDVEKLQRIYPDYQIELQEGIINIMSPSDATSGQIGGQFIRLLGNWVDAHKLGYFFDSSTGYRLPNGDTLSPDASFISRARLKVTPRTYLALVPDFVGEIKSSRDSIRELRRKIQVFLRQGVKVAILIDPDKHTVTVYRPGSTGNGGETKPSVTLLRDGDTLTIPELFPGWEIPITALWPPVFT